jgi:AcrR family transcriptional regulator
VLAETLANIVSLSSDHLTPRAREIATTARELLEAEGPEALSMRRLAERLGIRAPSIYKHLPDKEAVEDAVISGGFEELAVMLERALARDGLGALGAAYRRFAKRHPHLYRLMTDRPLRRDRLQPGVEERAAAPVIAAAGGDEDLARAAFAFAHGMTILELNGRFPPGADLDAAWRRGMGALEARGD